MGDESETGPDRDAALVFTAEWSAPSQLVRPSLDALSDDLARIGVPLRWVDADNGDALSEERKVEVLATAVLEVGDKVRRITGAFIGAEVGW